MHWDDELGGFGDVILHVVFTTFKSKVVSWYDLEMFRFPPLFVDAENASLQPRIGGNVFFL